MLLVTNYLLNKYEVRKYFSITEYVFEQIKIFSIGKLKIYAKE